MRTRLHAPLAYSLSILYHHQYVLAKLNLRPLAHKLTYAPPASTTCRLSALKLIVRLGWYGGTKSEAVKNLFHHKRSESAGPTDRGVKCSGYSTARDMRQVLRDLSAVAASFAMFRGGAWLVH